MVPKTTVAHTRTASTAGIDLNRRNDIIGRIGRRIVKLIKLKI